MTGTVLLSFEDERYGPKVANVVNRPSPEPGWYYVVYADGYESFSPAKAFEEGNTPVVRDSEDHPHAKSADLRSFCQNDIENWFTYHAPSPAQLVQYDEIRTAAKIFAETINRHVPGGADKSAAIRLLRETVMTANAAIACYVGAPKETIPVPGVETGLFNK